MTLAIDASTPVAVHHVDAIPTTASFTAPAGSVLIALFVWNSGASPTIASSGLTWTALRVDTTAHLAVWISSVVPSTAARTVQATDGNGGGGADGFLKVWVFTVAAGKTVSAAQTTNGSSTTDNHTASAYTSTVDQSQGIAIARNTAQTGALASSTDTNENGTANGAFQALQLRKASATTPAGTAVTFNMDATGSPAAWEWIAVEVAEITNPYPVVGTVSGSAGTNLSTAANISPPAGTAVGDLLLAYLTSDNTGGTDITASTGWTQLFHSENGTTVTHALFARIADGSANDTLNPNGAAQDYCAEVIRVTNHGVTDVATDIIVGTPAQAASGNANPPSVTGSSKDWLILASAAVDFTTGNSISADPASYTNVSTRTSASSTSSCGQRIARRDVTGTTDDPGTFTNTSRTWIANTIMVPPAASGPVNYDETGRAVSIVSTVTAPTDQADWEEVARPIVLSFTTWTVSDLLSLHELALAVNVTATTTLTDQADFEEPAKAVSVVSTVTAPTDQADWEDAGKSVSIVSTVTGTDAVGGFDETGLAVTIVSTVTGIDQLGYVEALNVSASSTVTGVDQADFEDAAKAVSIVSTVTKPTDQADWEDAAKPVDVVATVTKPTDQADFEDPAKAVTIVATITGQDVLSGAPINYNETGRNVAIVSTVTETDQADFRNLGLSTVSAATVTGTDSRGGLEVAAVTVVSTISTAVDQADWHELARLDVFSDVTGIDRVPDFADPWPVVREWVEEVADYEWRDRATTVAYREPVAAIDRREG